MSFLKDIISKSKTSGFGNTAWVKRGEIQKQKDDELAAELQEQEKKRKQKEIEKLREFSYSRISNLNSGVEEPGKEDKKRKWAPSLMVRYSAFILQREEEGKSITPDGFISSFEADVINLKKNENKRQKTDEEEFKEITVEILPEERNFTPEEIEDIKKRLRDIGQPIKYFGENNTQAYNRLIKFEQDDLAKYIKEQETNNNEDKEFDAQMTNFQKVLKTKHAAKKPIDLEIGTVKTEDVIEIRHTKHSVYPDYKKYEKELKQMERKDKCNTILKWIK